MLLIYFTQIPAALHKKPPAKIRHALGNVFFIPTEHERQTLRGAFVNADAAADALFRVVCQFLGVLGLELFTFNGLGDVLFVLQLEGGHRASLCAQTARFACLAVQIEPIV
jgi:hypothetical protein